MQEGVGFGRRSFVYDVISKLQLSGRGRAKPRPANETHGQHSQAISDDFGTASSDMVRLPLSLLLATALILAGAALQRVAVIDTSPLKFAISLVIMGLGLFWLRATIKEWRTR